MKKFLLPFLFAFLGLFLLYPLGYVVRESLWVAQPDGSHSLSLAYFQLTFDNALYRASLLNSLIIACSVTLACLLFTVPLAALFERVRFPGKTLFETAMLLPLILPPFVGAIGMKHFFARFGTVNLWLAHLGLVSLQDPPDWFGAGGFLGIILLAVLHLFPIAFLSIRAALANLDPALRDAAANLGASTWRQFRTITLPLALPGIFAGGSIVFVSAFTDLGTPLVFDFQKCIPVQIYNASSETGTNPIGNALVLVTLAVVLAFFLAGKKWGDQGQYAMVGRSATWNSEITPSPLIGWLITGGVSFLLFLSVIPHLGVMLSSVSDVWFMTPLPTRTSFGAYGEVFANELTTRVIRNSLFYSSFSAGLDVVLGIAIAHLLARETFPGKALLDSLAMLPLALPGLVLAFGYVACFNTTSTFWSWLNPRNDPTFLLIISYSVRRLPYIVRAAYAGYQQTSVQLEEAAWNLGASYWRALRSITLPLIAANLIAGTILTFAFAMLEVSDSLILAMESRFAPITKGIAELLGRPNPESVTLASALGVLAMVLLGGTFVLASRLLGKKMGSLFRA
jgi:iron(III) transport system permease protein